MKDNYELKREIINGTEVFVKVFPSAAEKSIRQWRDVTEAAPVRESFNIYMMKEDTELDDFLPDTNENEGASE
jgi:hypothetical protein